MATSKVTCPAGAYTSLGTSGASSGMLISPTNRIQIVAASSQPAANAVGHPLNQMMDGKPFYAPFTSQQIWAQPLDAASVDVVVTI